MAIVGKPRDPVDRAELRDLWVRSRPDYISAKQALNEASNEVQQVKAYPHDDPLQFVNDVRSAMYALAEATAKLERVKAREEADFDRGAPVGT